MNRSRTGGGSIATAWLYPLTIVVVGAILYLPLVGRQGFNSHEVDAPYYRVLEYLHEIRQGHWLPQTFPHFFQGAGFAYPRFYPPVANAVATAVTAVTGDVVVGVHLSFLLSVILSALTMYALLLSVTRDRLVAMIGAVTYIGFPYRFADVFVRGALAECWSFVWYPVILLGGWRWQEQKRVPWYLPLAIAGLALTHPQMALYFAAISAVLLLIWRPLPSRGMAVSALGAIALAIGLSAWYWMPQQFYLPGVWASVPGAVWADAAHVVPERVPFWTALTGVPARRGVDVSVGWIGLIANLLAVHGWLRPTGAPERLQARARWLLVPWWMLLGFMVAPGTALTVLPASFGYIQFPWRVLGLMGFLATASIGCSIVGLRNRRITAGALLVLSAVVLRSGIWANMRPDLTSDQIEQRLATANRRRGLTGASEYLPRTVPGLDEDYEGAMDQLSGAIRAAPRASEGVVVQSFTRVGSASDVVIEARRPGVVVLPLIYYDFYSARTADGSVVATRDSLGLLAIRVPSGHHAISLRERLTPVYWIGLAVSVLSGVAAAIYASRRRVRG